MPSHLYMIIDKSRRNISLNNVEHPTACYSGCYQPKASYDLPMNMKKGLDDDSSISGLDVTDRLGCYW